MTLLDFISAWRNECGIGPRRDEIYRNAPGWCGLTVAQIRLELLRLRLTRQVIYRQVHYEYWVFGHYSGNGRGAGRTQTREREG